MQMQSFKNKYPHQIGSPVCGDEANIAPTDFNYCNPIVVLSEIKKVYLGKTGTRSFVDWADVNEWEGRISQTSNDIEALRPITVIGDKPLPQTTIRTISNKRKVATDKTHVINCTIDEASDLIHDFAVAQKSGRYMKLWYETTGNYMFGGNKGIIAFVTIEMVLPRGGGEIMSYILTATWSDLYTEERIPSPLTNDIGCPMVTGLHFISADTYTIIVGWDDTIFASYQYAYNTTGDAPDEEDYIETTSHEIEVNPLEPETHYFIFVRILCPGVTGSPAYIEADTLALPSITLPEIPGFSEREWDGGSINPVITSGVTGSPVWEYSPNDIDWYAMPSAYPVGDDSRLQCQISFVGNTIVFENLHRGMLNLYVRLTMGVTISNSLQIFVDPYDIDLNSYFERMELGGYTLSTPEINALKQLIKDLQGDYNPDYATAPISLNFLAIYPILGIPNVSVAPLNLINAAFTLTPNGSTFFGSKGYFFGGSVSDYCDTDIVPNDELPVDSQHLSVYQQVDLLTVSGVAGTDGIAESGTQIIFSGTQLQAQINSASNVIQAASGVKKGFIMATRNSSDVQIITAGADIHTLTYAASDNATAPIKIGSCLVGSTVVLDNGVYISYASVGESLNDTDGEAYCYAVEAFQAAIGRDV